MEGFYRLSVIVNVASRENVWVCRWTWKQVWSTGGELSPVLYISGTWLVPDSLEDVLISWVKLTRVTWHPDHSHSLERGQGVNQGVNSKATVGPLLFATLCYKKKHPPALLPLMITHMNSGTCYSHWLWTFSSILYQWDMASAWLPWGCANNHQDVYA